jgi:predicted extracellular nuclease
MDYSFGNYKLEVASLPDTAAGGLQRERTAAAGVGQLAVATFNVENLDPNDPPEKFAALAKVIVDNMRSPDLISVEEVQDDNGATNNSVVSAEGTWKRLTDAIAAAGGPQYEHRQIDPVDDQDGGEPGGNIRVGFLFRTDRGLAFVDRPGGDSTTPVAVEDGSRGPQLSISPGRIAPANSAFTNSRKPLAGEFTYDGHTLFAVANHWNSKGGDDPLFGRFQPPARSSEVQRNQQAQLVHDFAADVLDADPNARVIVLGDLNDFEFSSALGTLEGSPAILDDLIANLPQDERYSYVFEGNSQTLDHVVTSQSASSELRGFDVQATDSVDPAPNVSFVSATSNEPDDAPGGADGATTQDVVVDGDNRFRLRAERSEDGSGRVYTLTYRATDACGNSVERSATVTVPVR